MVDWTVFAIKPSAYITGLCYSIFRLEPYGLCVHSCTYCYARWYRRGPPRPQWWVVRAWARLARSLERVWPKPFFRLATLSDPLQQGVEDQAAAALEMLRVAWRYRVPVVVNTKSDMVARSPWLDVICALADEGLVLVQISAAFDDGLSRVLEPRAPPTSRRLEALEVLREHGVPVVVRVQPLVPGLEEVHLRVAREALERGALGLIGESVRETEQGFREMSRLLGLDVAKRAGLEPYQLAEVEGGTPLYHPPAAWRRRMHRALYDLARGYGRPYAVCKDGSQPWHELGRDCCLTWLAVRERALRPTLHEYVRLGGRQWPEGLGHPYVYGDMVKNYPGPVAKALRAHERRLARLIAGRAWARLLEPRLEP